MKEHYNLLAKDKQLLPMEYIRTPKEIWEVLSQEFAFTVDACASDKNHLVDKYWTKEQDALLQDWDHEIVYCHPMFDRYIPKFVRKLVNQNVFVFSCFLLQQTLFTFINTLGCKATQT